MHQTQTNETDTQRKPDEYELVIDEVNVEERKKEKRSIKDTSHVSPWYLFGVVGQLGYSIALPIAGGAILGRFIDDRFGTYPRTTLSLLLLGVFVAGVGFVLTVRDAMGARKRKN